jgi:hypothetical protein
MNPPTRHASQDQRHEYELNWSQSQRLSPEPKKSLKVRQKQNPNGSFRMLLLQSRKL